MARSKWSPPRFGAEAFGRGCSLAITIDTLVDGVHFPSSTGAADVAYKTLAVNLSDLAAMGASPLAAIYELTAGHKSADWLDEFEAELVACGNSAGIELNGRVRQRGALTVSLQAFGVVRSDRAMTRGDARDGDVVMVTGVLGDAGAGLAIVKGGLNAEAVDRELLVGRLNRPTPRVEEGACLLGLAHAAIDVSDGLLGDLNHILEASGCGATIDSSAVPLSEAALRVAGRAAATEYALGAGDDYELCFTCAPAAVDAVTEKITGLGTQVTRIGRIESTPGLRCIDASGRIIQPAVMSYQHFS